MTELQVKDLSFAKPKSVDCRSVTTAFLRGVLFPEPQKVWWALKFSQMRTRPGSNLRKAERAQTLPELALMRTYIEANVIVSLPILTSTTITSTSEEAVAHVSTRWWGRLLKAQSVALLRANVKMEEAV